KLRAGSAPSDHDRRTRDADLQRDGDVLDAEVTPWTDPHQLDRLGHRAARSRHRRARAGCVSIDRLAARRGWLLDDGVHLASRALSPNSPAIRPLPTATRPPRDRGVSTRAAEIPRCAGNDMSQSATPRT